MTRAQSLKFLGGLALLAVAMAGQALLPSVADSSLLAGAFFDAGHVPLFTLFALVALWLSRSTIPGSGARHYLVAFVLVVIAGLGTEFIQKFGARDAGWMDFGRDLLGGIGGLLIARAFDPGPRSVRAILVVAGLGLIAVGVAELGLVYRDYRGRDAAFPAIAGFDGPWEPRFVHGHHAALDLVEGPDGWGEGRVGRVTFGPGDFPYPSLSIHEPCPDWRGYDVFRMEVRSEVATRLIVRVHDAAHDNSYRDRFNREIVIEPGLNEIVIPLDEVRSGPRDRQLDLGRIRGVAIFAEKPSTEFQLWFENLRLERLSAGAGAAS